MPQVFNDESVIPALEAQGISRRDAVNYAIVGCVELTTHGNNLGWSDAAMFNLVKALELALNDGVCLLTGKQLGPRTGYLTDFAQLRGRGAGLRDPDRLLLREDDRGLREGGGDPPAAPAHARCSPRSSTTASSGDSTSRAAAPTTTCPASRPSSRPTWPTAWPPLKKLRLRGRRRVDEGPAPRRAPHRLRSRTRSLRQILLNKAPKYGNDVEWVDEIGDQVGRLFRRASSGRVHELPRRPLPHRPVHGECARPHGRERRRHPGRRGSAAPRSPTAACRRSTAATAAARRPCSPPWPG